MFSLIFCLIFPSINATAFDVGQWFGENQNRLSQSVMQQHIQDALLKNTVVLTGLNLNNNDLQIIGPLIKQYNTFVENIELGGNNITNLTPICECIHLTQLSLDGNKIDANQLEGFWTAFEKGFNNLEALNLSNIPLGDEAVAIFVSNVLGNSHQLLENGQRRLKKLFLINTQITDTAIPVLLGLRLHVLDVSHNHLTDQAVAYLTPPRTLKDLKINNTHITMTGAKKLATHYQNLQLEMRGLKVSQQEIIQACQNSDSIKNLVTNNRFGSPKKRLCFILSVDGGGIRGIIPATILHYIETEVSKRVNRRGPSGELLTIHLSECFDGLAGTSTGSLIGLSIIAQTNNQEGKKQNLYMTDVLDIYKTKGGQIFSQESQSWLSWNTGYLGTYYGKTGIENVLKKTFGKQKLGQDTHKDMLIPVYDLGNSRIEVFNSDRIRQNQEEEIYIIDAARATTAAPTYFPAHVIKRNEHDHTFIDGGIYANNPADLALLYYQKKYLNPYCSEDQYDELHLLSLGTGATLADPEKVSLASSGKLSWASEIPHILMDSSSQKTEKIVQGIAAQDKRISYMRIQTALQSGEHAMDDYSEKKLQCLQVRGSETIQRCEKELNNFAQLLAEKIQSVCGTLVGVR